jgi:hypothetical protein
MNDWILLFSLVFPRLTLWIAWLNGEIPPNTIPFWVEFFITLCIPRLLILYYIVITLGVSSGWFIAHCVAWAISLLFAITSNRNEPKFYEK